MHSEAGWTAAWYAWCWLCQIQYELVASASTVWPLHFSAMFEAYRVDGPPLPRDDVLLAINSCGVFLLTWHYDVIVGFHFYDVINVKAESRCPPARPPGLYGVTSQLK